MALNVGERQRPEAVAHVWAEPRFFKIRSWFCVQVRLLRRVRQMGKRVGGKLGLQKPVMTDRDCYAIALIGLRLDAQDLAADCSSRFTMRSVQKMHD